MSDKQSGGAWNLNVIDKVFELMRIEAEKLAALKRDAERYRWLRAHAVDERYHGDKFIYFACDFENWNDVDAAIDAAMKESK